MAESYVTVVVAAPLFLIVMVSVMSMVSTGGGSGGSSMLIMYMVTFIMLPLAHLGFAVVISSMNPEV